MKNFTPFYLFVVLVFFFPHFVYAQTNTNQNSQTDNSNYPNSLILSLVEEVPISCYGTNDAGLQATVTPAGTYTYTCYHPTMPSNSNTTGYFGLLEVGTHTVVATDGANSVSETISFTNPDPLDIVFTTDTMVSCLGNDGTLSISISGGTTIVQPYLTWWVNTANPGVYLNNIVTIDYANSLSNLPAGNYNVTIEDDHGCFYNETASIEVANPININITNNAIQCYNGSTPLVISGTGGVSYPTLYYSTLNFLVNGSPIATSYTAGTYTVQATDAAGCSATTQINLLQPEMVVNTFQLTACDVYTWHGNTYSMSGTYTQTIMNLDGCIQLSVLMLTINNSTTEALTATSCDMYTWNGTTYTTSGQYTYTSLNSSGCIHTSLLDLIINSSTMDSQSIISCDLYIWNANVYTSSGQYTYTTLNSSGCIHISLLDLIINSSTTETQSIISCDSYIWNANGNTYTASGVYTNTSINIDGCIHTTNLDLTINNSTSETQTTTMCDMYTWNGTTYTASGQYTYTSINSSGCLNTSTLELTLNFSNTYTMTIGACNSYFWSANGLTYTMAGTYQVHLNNSFGCDSLVVLNLTMTNGIVLSAKAFLSGPYDTISSLMKDDLRMLNVIPITRLNWFTNFNCPNEQEISIGGGNQSTANSILSITGPNAIVDWIFVEIRDGGNSGAMVASKWALLQRDGDIVSCIDGASPLTFSCVCPGNYYISVKHRNHLGIMSANTIALSSATATFDFSDPLSDIWVKPTYPSVITNLPRRIQGNKALLWGGDANTNKNVKYNGSSNDKDQILYDLGTWNPNDVLYPTYKNSDLNMDGKVQYNNLNNDRNWLLYMIGIASTPSTANYIISQHTP